MPTFNFDTGPATLPDIGTLEYNKCNFSPLFQTNVNAVEVQDDAGRTTKWIDYTLTVEGVVTIPDNQDDILVPMTTLQELLTQQAGILIYEGRGLELRVNVPGSGVAGYDLAWGPIPKVLEFTPLGGGRSAMIKWQVQTRISKLTASTGSLGPVLQFNMDSSVGYGEDGYSTLEIKGTLEIPLTRPTQATRTLTSTVDNFRHQFMTQVAASIDLLRFRVTSRTFDISRDRRTMIFHFAAEELPPMGLPAYCTVARGNFSFAPAKQGMGLCTWFCSLKVTYNVIKDQPRRVSWLAFLALLRLRMSQSQFGNIAGINQGNQNNANFQQQAVITIATAGILNPAVQNWISDLRNPNTARNSRKAWIIDLRGDEGMYLDSRTMTWQASWRLTTTFSHILVASGVWTRVPIDGGNMWKTSVQGVSGYQGNLVNRLDPSQDFIVDFGASG